MGGTMLNAITDNFGDMNTWTHTYSKQLRSDDDRFIKQIHPTVYF